MKAPTPRTWKLAMIGASAPSPQVLAMAILGGAGLSLTAAASTGSSSSNNTAADAAADDERGLSVNSRSKQLHSAERTTAPRIIGGSQRSNTGLTVKPRIPSSAGLMLATSSSSSSSNVMLATSDAFAERSASLAAAARLSSGNASSPIFSVNNADKVVEKAKGIADDDASIYAAAGRKQANNDGGDSSKDADNSINDNSLRPTTPQTNNNDDEEDSYPAFTPYHNSLLKKYLTPAVWSKLSRLKTSRGTSIEDVIRAGLALPIGADPPRGVGVLAGDAECYEVFRELLDPIISEYHGIGSYEEWMDPELPMESNFGEKDGGGNSSTANTSSSSGSSSSSAITPMASCEDDYGVMKSSGADEDSDENDDSSFLLNEEDDNFVEYIALPSSPPAQQTTVKSQSSSSSTTTTGSLSTTTTTTTTIRNVHAIASKRKHKLRRHSTIINNPRLVTNREADPDGKYIISTRIRVARSLDGIKFPTTMSRSDRRRVQSLIRECTQNSSGPTMGYNNGTYLPVLSMANDQNLDLIERHVLFDNPNEWTIASGLGRDWPDGRALYANVANLRNETPDFMIWVNEEDHLRIMCLRNGGDIQGVFTTLMNGVRELERELTKRGWHFAYDSRLGYLTSCPTNVGTTMRASVHVKLVNLGRLDGFFELVERLKLEVRGKYGETDRRYTGVFDISNAERLGKSEVHLINVMVEGVAKLIELERRLEAGEVVDIDDIAKELEHRGVVQ